jgi:hypothetical protein
MRNVRNHKKQFFVKTEVPRQGHRTNKFRLMAVGFFTLGKGPNGHKIYHHLSLQDTPKFTQIGIFGLKIHHLATLVQLHT